jgi:glucokinase
MSEIIGIDVGGTSVKGARFATSGAVLEERGFATPADPGQLVVGLLSLASSLRTPATVAAGVAVPGVVDAVGGRAVYAANLGWRDVPLRALLSAELELPVVLEHDVRAAGVAEAAGGELYFVAIGTGIASAHVVDDRPWPGASGQAGELGHVPVHPGGESCACGQRGCLETYASASAIARRYRAAGGTALSSAEIADVRDHDALAAAVWADAVRALGIALTWVTLVIDPPRIVIGGGLAQAGAALIDPLRDDLAARLAWRSAPPVEAGRLGPGAARRGAAELARRALVAEGCSS